MPVTFVIIEILQWTGSGVWVEHGWTETVSSWQRGVVFVCGGKVEKVWGASSQSTGQYVW